MWTFFKQPNIDQEQIVKLSDLNDVSLIAGTENTDLATAIEEMLKNHLKTTNYDRTVYPYDVFRSQEGDNYKIDSYNLLQTYKGANCIGLSQDLCTLLGNSGITSHLIPSTLPDHYRQPGFPRFCHTATVVKFFTGSHDELILLDSGFHISEPIVLKDNVPYQIDINNRGHWTFEWQGGDYIKASIDNAKSQRQQSFFYTVQSIQNPDESITALMANHDNIYVLVSRDEDGKKASITIDFNRQELQLKYSEYDIKIMSFTELTSINYKTIINGLLTDNICRYFNLEPDALHNRVYELLGELVLNPLKFRR